MGSRAGQRNEIICLWGTSLGKASLLRKTVAVSSLSENARPSEAVDYIRRTQAIERALLLSRGTGLILINITGKIHSSVSRKFSHRSEITYACLEHWSPVWLILICLLWGCQAFVIDKKLTKSLIFPIGMNVAQHFNCFVKIELRTFLRRNKAAHIKAKSNFKSKEVSKLLHPLRSHSSPHTYTRADLTCSLKLHVFYIQPTERVLVMNELQLSTTSSPCSRSRQSASYRKRK